MKTVRQDYEKNFKCIADKCPETCCSGWLIMVDEDSLARYEKYSGKIPERVKESIDFGLFQKKNLPLRTLKRWCISIPGKRNILKKA